MPVLFNVTFDLGRNASLAIVAGAIADLETLGDTALRVAELQAEAEARRFLTDTFVNEGPRALINLVRQRELPGEFNRLGSDLEEAAYMYERLLEEGLPWRIPRRYRYAVLATALFPTAWPSSPIELPGLSSVFQRLLAAETAQRMPSLGFRVQSLRYENPVSVELIAAVGAATTGLAFLLNIVRDWGPRRRREHARADAEERIQAAHAKDAEDRVVQKAELRKLIVEKIARGEVDIPAETITELLATDIVGAAHRLAERELVYDRRELPNS